MDHSIERIDAGLQQLFPTFAANEKVNNLKTLAEEYHQYKMDYVRHLSFTPEGKNLSKLIFIVNMVMAETKNYTGFSNTADQCLVAKLETIL